MVQRELREGARRPFNHWLRVASAGGGMILFYLVAEYPKVPASVIGGRLFASIHTLLLLLVFCFVPVMTADCIAREKREGTLGLLFLTPLTAGGIVVGKGAMQAFRIFTLWLAVLPVLIVPVLLGGVGWTDGVTAITIEFCVTILCIAAGLLASSLAKGRAAVLVLGLVLGGFLVSLFGEVMARSVFRQLAYFIPPSMNDCLSLITGFDCSGDLSESFRRAGVWSDIFNLRQLQKIWPSILSENVIGAVLIFLVVVKYAAHRVVRSWQDNPPSLRQEKLLRQYCTPVFRRWFARRTQRALDWHPIAWLQQYSWKARVFKWGFCLACVLAECAILLSFENQGFPDECWAWQQMLLLALGIAFTFVGVNNFLKEKETGALELILVTPLSANQIIFGRAWGLWKQWLAPALICCGSYLAIMATTWLQDQNWFALCLAVCGFMSLPILTTYFALCVKNMIVAAILTWSTLFCVYPIALALLHVAGQSFQEYWHGSYMPGPLLIWLPVSVVAANLALALPIYFRLRRNLSRRRYSF